MLLHGVLLLAWLSALRLPTRPPASGEAGPVPISYLLLAPAPVPAAQRRAEPAAALDAATRSKTLPRTRAAPPPLQPQPINTPPALPPPAFVAAPTDNAVAPEPRLLDTPATQRALRDAARAPGWSAQATQSQATPASRTERLGQAIESGATGDCLKGEYAGAGMVLLSVPFLALAALRDQCRR